MTEPVAKDVEDEQKDKEKEKRKWMFLSPIAKPLVTKKLNKKALKVVKKGTLFITNPCLVNYEERQPYILESINSAEPDVLEYASLIFSLRSTEIRFSLQT